MLPRLRAAEAQSSAAATGTSSSAEGWGPAAKANSAALGMLAGQVTALGQRSSWVGSGWVAEAKGWCSAVQGWEAAVREGRSQSATCQWQTMANSVALTRVE